MFSSTEAVPRGQFANWPPGRGPAGNAKRRRGTVLSAPFPQLFRRGRIGNAYRIDGRWGGNIHVMLHPTLGASIRYRRWIGQESKNCQTCAILGIVPFVDPAFGM
ncbi:MAG: hypothetical protein D6753_06105 [Planctomycetota bacterium]|nr:MAG: hypothetical protein D6753_06105 [Planctomycetota bacterium]